MRLTFPSGDYEPISFDQGELLVGSDPACALSLKSPDIRAMHAVLSIDPRGMVLSVLAKEGAPTRVNGHLVAELAILRAGDRIEFGSIVVQLKSNDGQRDVPPARGESRLAVSGTYPRVILRGLSGDWTGRFARLKETLTFGSDPDCDVDLPSEKASALHAKLELDMEGIFLRAQSAGDGVEVNGHPFESVVLKPNDQVVIGGERFLVEAPGYRPVTVTPLPIANPSVTGVMRRIETEQPPPLAAQPALAPASISESSRVDFVTEMPDWLWFTLIIIIAIGSGLLVWYLRS